MGQVHTSRTCIAQSVMMSMSPSSSGPGSIPAATTTTTTTTTDDDDLESNMVEAKTNIRSFLDDLPSMRKELGPRYVLEIIDEATKSAAAARDLLQTRLQTNYGGKDPLVQTGTYKVRFHLKCIEQSLERIGQIREECLVEASTGHRGDELQATVVTPPRDAPQASSNSSSTGAPIRHVLAGTFVSRPSRDDATGTSGFVTMEAAAAANDDDEQNGFTSVCEQSSPFSTRGGKKERGKTPATRTSPRRKVITKGSNDRRGEDSATKTSTQSADDNLLGRRKSSRKLVPTDLYESPEVPKAYQKKNRNKSARITMRLRSVKAGDVDGFVMEEEVLYPVKIKERDGRMVTVAWCGGYSGTIKVRKGQVEAPTPQNIADWNHIAADANEIRERLIKDREAKGVRKRKKRQEEVEAKRAKKSRNERLKKLEGQRKIKECRNKMLGEYGPPLDSNLTSVPTAREEGDIKMQGSRLIYYAHEDDTPECIAKRFGVPVARVVYDNEGHVHDIAEKSMLKAYTPIILPSEI